MTVRKLNPAPRKPRTVKLPIDTSAAPPVAPDAVEIALRRSAAGQAPAYPWDEVSEDAVQAYVVDLPAKLHRKLKWLGSTTWGTSMRKIVVEALDREADRLLKAKGIDL